MKKAKQILVFLLIYLTQMWHQIYKAMYQHVVYIILSTQKILKQVRQGESKLLLFKQSTDQIKSQQEFIPLRDSILNENNSQQAIEFKQLQLTKNLTGYLKKNGQRENLKRLIDEEQSIQNNTQFSDGFKLYYQAKCRRQYLEIQQQQNPPIYHINQQISSDNPEVLFYVLSECLKRDQNRNLIKTNTSSKIDLRSLFYPSATDLKCFKFHTISENFDVINNDQNKKAQFIQNFKEKVSQILNLRISDIDIYDLVKGSVEVYFTIKSKENLNQNELQALEQVCCGRIEVYHYFACGYEYGKPVGLSSEDFCPEYNKSWGQNYQEKVQRGPNYHKYDYYYPKGYYGYALNIKNRYGQDQQWLQKDGNDQEWRILYHGTKQQRMQSIVQKGLIPGIGQSFKGYKCQYSGELVGNGVYFSDKTQVCLGYTSETKIGEKVFVLIFQSRVNPKAVRASPEMISTGNFLVKETKDIRPYRILLNEI